MNQKNINQCSLPEPFNPNQHYADNTYYQVLVIDFTGDDDSHKSWKTKLITQTKQEFDNEKYKLDQDTRQKINQSYQESDSSDNLDHTTIGSTLPSPGSMLNKGLIEALLKQQDSSSDSYLPIELNNFYEPLRTLLHTRKMSQLIAKTWDAQLEANKILKVPEESDLLKLAIENQNNIPLDIFDGLIARAIFLLSDSSEPDGLIPESLDVYYPLKSSSETTEQARFLILPNSKGWQTIGLSLLMAGQVYYRVDENGNILKEEEEGGYYRQVNQSILSTGETVMKYALDVSLSLYKGDIRELDLRGNKSSPAYLAVLPYPAIPSEINLSHDKIRAWAEADDTTGDFPFYIKDSDEKYLIGAQHHTPPYPYLPSSCC